MHTSRLQKRIQEVLSDYRHELETRDTEMREFLYNLADQEITSLEVIAKTAKRLLKLHFSTAPIA